MEQQIVTLKDGNQVLNGFVMVAMNSLRAMVNGEFGITGVLALYDLMSICEDSEYAIAEPQAELLESLNLMNPNRSVHEDIKSVVRSAVRYEADTFLISNPVKADV